MAEEKPKRTRKPKAEAPETVVEVEPAPTVEAVAAEAEAPAEADKPQAAEKPKRAARAAKPKAAAKSKPAKPATRKPIVRLPKPEHARGRRQERRGVVVSDRMDKTIVVKVDTIKAHPRYKKVVRRSAKFHAHDERNDAHVGDVVRIVETRPLSKTKNWRLAEVMERAR
jgi:small subunit ribosomal protein S17